MLRNYSLSSGHYASKWTVREVSDRYDRELINQKALEFSTTTDMKLREKLQLDVLEAFHGYLIKYFNLIVYGQVPALNGPQGKDVQGFLSLMLPKGTVPTLLNLRSSAKHLHLAFKNCTTSDEVYDILVTVFLDVCSHYDPNYTQKTEEVCKYVAKQPASKLIRIEDVSTAVDFDPIGCVRVLVRNHYLASVAGPRKKVQGYHRGEKWPPAKSFFESGPVGFVYFVTRWFKYYLQAYIQSQMGQLESREDVLQLDYIHGSNSSSFDDDSDITGGTIPNTEGNWTDQSGQNWSVDLSMVDLWRTLDVSKLDEAWVQKTDDFLFRTLVPNERYLLQLVFAKELTWTEIAKVFDINAETARNRFKNLMQFLQNRAKAKPKKPVNTM